MPWTAAFADGTNDVHVTPDDDLVDHLTEDCPCGVTTEPIPGPDGSIAWLVTHHSLDGRELHE
ncbi:hypothetical protein P3H15_27310 [Rhodococcus sp. T2V]|uniref:hypothetical protein n=1 Tax=Rhodococcus sp. T2V TaxID=3034164 RepID=UPI0023E0A9B4|nr:hypothetical protein [Rhodococcus sp. T2V]MDF3308731.1 hypothetical protein [Rhodococcus sp. T2V]